MKSQSSLPGKGATRRKVLALLAASVWPTLPWAADGGGVGTLLRAGACVVLLRHTATVSGIGDPPESSKMSLETGLCA